MFVKAPRPGLVKTRLGQAIGATAACAAYRSLVERVVAQMECLREVELRFSPDDAVEEIRPWLREDWRAAPQGNGALGERLARGFSEAFAEGCTRVVAIGSDCPDASADDVREAWQILESSEVVLGPASDGGYWLIGLRQPQPGLLGGISWGSESVLAETLHRAKAMRLQVQLLRILADIDTEQDWERYRASLEL